MGCDIHIYVEYSTKGEFWRNLTDNAGSRDYYMFGILAGVRYSGVQLFEPRGMPEGKIGWGTEKDYWTNVAPEKHPEWADDEGWTSRERAEKWVSSGYSKPDFRDGVLHRVSGPDWHSHSWLTADEVGQALEAYGRNPQEWPVPLEWVGIHAAMKAIEEKGGLTRVIFWFDN